MNEKGTAVLEKYDFKVIRTSRVRGAMLCDTSKGLKVLKEYRGTLGRLTFEEELLRKIMDKDIINVDMINPNRDGELLSIDGDGTKYIVKNWYAGRNPDVRAISDIEESAALLARLHNVMNDVSLNHCVQNRFIDISLQEEYEKHMKEIKRTRNFIKSKRRKMEFELKVLDCYSQFYNDAVDATHRLKESSYDKLLLQAQEQNKICHGSYNYHNICMNNDRLAVINFDKAKVDVQIRDLYDFLRKIMEKNCWDIKIGDRILESYSKIKPISREEMQVLNIMICYPEKFWKIINYYFNTNKAWISEKNMEKLQNICCQRHLKDKFTLFLSKNIVQ